MSIPVQPTDSDVLFGQVLSANTELLTRIAELEQALSVLVAASDRLANAEARVRDAEEGLEWPEGTERTDEEDEILARIYDESGDAGVEVAVAVRAARRVLGERP